MNSATDAGRTCNESRALCACGFYLPATATNCPVCGRTRRRHAGQPYPAGQIDRYDWVSDQTIGDPIAKAVLLALVSHDRPQSKLGPGVVNPRVKRLTKITELSDKTVRRALDRLKADGWVTVARRWAQGRQRASEYTIRQAEGLDRRSQ